MNSGTTISVLVALLPAFGSCLAGVAVGLSTLRFCGCFWAGSLLEAQLPGGLPGCRAIPDRSRSVFQNLALSGLVRPTLLARDWRTRLRSRGCTWLRWFRLPAGF